MQTDQDILQDKEATFDLNDMSDNSLLLLASNISVQLPAEVFANVTEDSVGLLYTLYFTSSLFPIAPDSRNESFTNVTVATPVVGAAVSGRNISNLASPVNVTLPITSTEVSELTDIIIYNMSSIASTLVNEKDNITYCSLSLFLHCAEL